MNMLRNITTVFILLCILGTALALMGGTAFLVWFLFASGQWVLAILTILVSASIFIGVWLTILGEGGRW